MPETLNRRRVTLRVSGNFLRLYAALSLLCHTVGAGLVERRLPGGDAAALARMLAENPDLMVQSTWAALLRLAGGLGAPVFAFLLAQRFARGGDGGRMLARLAALALLSEVPYDLCMSGQLWNPAAQSGALTLTVCLVMLYGLRLWRDKPGTCCRLARWAVVMAAVLWCNLLRTQAGLYLVLSAAIFYLCRDRRGTGLLLSALWTLAYVLCGMLLAGDGGALAFLPALLSVYALWFYDGADSGGPPWLLFSYPVLLLAVCCVGMV